MSPALGVRSQQPPHRNSPPQSTEERDRVGDVRASPWRLGQTKREGKRPARAALARRAILTLLGQKLAINVSRYNAYVPKLRMSLMFQSMGFIDAT